jgi:hypothetical protein
MLVSSEKRRARPSMKSLGLSVLVCLVALYFAFLVFGYYLYVPLGAAVIVAMAAVWVRNRSLRQGLPEPYGKGKVSTIDAKKATRQGILIMLVGAFATVGLLGSVYLLPPVVFFTVVFGLAAGLPLNEVVFFALVARLERTSESKIFLITEEVENKGEPALVKTYRMGRLDAAVGALPSSD